MGAEQRRGLDELWGSARGQREALTWVPVRDIVPAKPKRTAEEMAATLGVSRRLVQSGVCRYDRSGWEGWRRRPRRPRQRGRGNRLLLRGRPEQLQLPLVIRRSPPPPRPTDDPRVPVGSCDGDRAHGRPPRGGLCDCDRPGSRSVPVPRVGVATSSSASSEPRALARADPERMAIREIRGRTRSGRANHSSSCIGNGPLASCPRVPDRTLLQAASRHRHAPTRGERPRGDPQYDRGLSALVLGGGHHACDTLDDRPLEPFAHDPIE